MKVILVKSITVIAALLMALLPFLCGNVMGRQSPYFEGNSFSIYLPVCVAYLLFSGLALWVFMNKSIPGAFLQGGIFIFFIGACIAAIYGLAVAPDVSIAMLAHPEREHFRYLMLFLALVLFSIGFTLIVRNSWHVFPRWNRWIVLAFLLGLAEMCWEFYHHYNYVAGLRLWLAGSHTAEGFSKAYDSFEGVKFGAVGRFFQYITVAWLGYILLQCGQLTYRTLIPIVLLSLLGIFSAIVVFNNGFPLPQPLQIFTVFFIPGMPFILVYWLGIGLLSNPISKKMKTADRLQFS